MYRVIALKQTRGIKNVSPKAAKKKLWMSLCTGKKDKKQKKYKSLLEG